MKSFNEIFNELNEETTTTQSGEILEYTGMSKPDKNDYITVTYKLDGKDFYPLMFSKKLLENKKMVKELLRTLNKGLKESL